MNTKKGFLRIVGMIVIVLIVCLAGWYFMENQDAGVDIDNSTDSQDIQGSGNYTNSSNTKTDQAPVVAHLAPNNTVNTSVLAGYNLYTNSTIGFSTLVSEKGHMGNLSTKTVEFVFNGKNPQSLYVYIYGLGQDTDIRSNIFVWQEEQGVCLPDYVTTRDSSEVMHSTAGYAYTKRMFGDAAMGQYTDMFIYSIANGKKQYCVVGKIDGHRPYNLEGQVYDDREQINAKARAEFANILEVFVNNFKFI